MTVSATTPKTVYFCDGIVRDFAVLFPLRDPADLCIYITDEKNKTTRLSEGYLYYPADCTVRYPAKSYMPALPNGYKLTLMRRTPLTQDTDLIATGNLDVEVLEKLADKIFLALQEIKDETARAVKFPVCEKTAPMDARDYLNAVMDVKNEALETVSATAAQAEEHAQAARDAAQKTEDDARAAALSAQEAAQKASLAVAQAGVAAAHAQTARDYASGDNGYSARHYAEMAQAAFERAGLYFNGPWSEDTVYGPNDFVSVETGGKYDFYISLTNENTAPLTDGASWKLFFSVDGSVGGSGNARQVVVSGAPLTFTPGARTVVSNISNAKASNTSNVSSPYTPDGYASSEWPSTPLKINAVAGAAWTGQRSLTKKINTIRIRQSRYDGYRITSVKVQIAPDKTPIWNVKESDWADLGTYELQDAFEFDELTLPDYELPSAYYAMRILANANGPADETVKYWGVDTVEMITVTPPTLTAGPLVGSIATGFENGNPKDIPVKLTAAKAVSAPQSAGTWGVYAGADGAVSAGGVQQGGAEFPDGAETGSVFFNVQEQKNYVKQAQGWTEFDKLYLGQITTDETGTVTSCKAAAKNMQPWALEAEQIPALPYLPVSGGTVEGDFAVGSVSPFFKVLRNGNNTELYSDDNAAKITFLNDVNAVRLQHPQNQTGSPLLAAEQKGVADGIGTLNAQGKQPMNEVQGGTVEELDVAGGTLSPLRNRTYKATLSSSVAFTLPEPVAGEENYALVYADVAADIGINWGDVLFYNSVPGETLTAGKYEFIFSYDPAAAKWTAGVLPKGAA